MSTNKLPRESRLCGSANYTGRFTSKLRSGHFILLSRESSAPISRIGVSLSKKHIPLAVVRTRVRRQVKELFRTSRCSMNPKDFVIRATRRITKTELVVVKHELKELWLREKK
ncbi:ribonuclease P protein component [Burkholderiales bacterium]|nr:ribonuclease P protein component [Burkholderiales bacterium]